jgi:glycosyltransferase involved in cell wall biosynthesis
VNDFINIVIPVYNEGENILSTLSEIKAKVSTPHKIFIIYDFEADNTLPAVRSLPESSVQLVKNQYGNGALNAIKTGFNRIENGVVRVVMADLADDLAIVDKMFEKISQGYDIVCGSRYMKGGKQIGGPWFKKFLSKTAGLSLYYLAGIPTHDVTNSFKMYTKRVLNDLTIESNGGFELGMEILIKAHLKGYKITEVPSIWKDRSAGESRFRLWQWLPKYLRWYRLALKGIKTN